MDRVVWTKGVTIHSAYKQLEEYRRKIINDPNECSAALDTSLLYCIVSWLNVCGNFKYCDPHLLVFTANVYTRKNVLTKPESFLKNLKTAVTNKTQNAAVYKVLLTLLPMNDAFFDKHFINQLTNLSNQKNSRAQTALGTCYKYGVGVKQNLTEAFKLYQAAAQQNFAPAQYALGRCYKSGIGVEKNLRQAFMFCQAAAKQGFALAQYILGSNYEAGFAVEKNLFKAKQWYTEALDAGIEKKFVTQRITKINKELQHTEKKPNNFKKRAAKEQLDYQPKTKKTRVQKNPSSFAFFPPSTQAAVLETNSQTINHQLNKGRHTTKQGGYF